MKLSVILFVGFTWVSATTVKGSASLTAPKFNRNQICQFFEYEKGFIKGYHSEVAEKRRDEIFSTSNCIWPPDSYRNFISEFNHTNEIISEDDAYVNEVFTGYCEGRVTDGKLFAAVKTFFELYTSLNAEEKELNLRDFLWDRLKTFYYQHYGYIFEYSDHLNDHARNCGVESIDEHMHDLVTLYRNALAKVLKGAELSYFVLKSKEGRIATRMLEYPGILPSATDPGIENVLQISFVETIWKIEKLFQVPFTPSIFEESPRRNICLHYNNVTNFTKLYLTDNTEKRQEEIFGAFKCIWPDDLHKNFISEFTDTDQMISVDDAYIDEMFTQYCKGFQSDELLFTTVRTFGELYTVFDAEKEELNLRNYIWDRLQNYLNQTNGKNFFAIDRPVERAVCIKSNYLLL